MTIAAWPAGLTYAPLVDAVSVAQPHPAASITQYEDGPARMRRRSYTRIQKLAYAIALKAAEYATFRSFVADDLDDGTAQFTMTVLLPEAGWATRRVYLEGGQYTARRHGSGWLVAFTLNVFPS
jgi:hypothetical protein